MPICVRTHDVDRRGLRFFSRPEWAGLAEGLWLTFRAQRQMQPGLHVWPRSRPARVDVIAGYTSDGLIAKI